MYRMHTSPTPNLQPSWRWMCGAAPTEAIIPRQSFLHVGVDLSVVRIFGALVSLLSRGLGFRPSCTLVRSL